ncbi:MAG: hypothetical protein ACI4U3_10080 [Traorella sp.]
MGLFDDFLIQIGWEYIGINRFVLNKIPDPFMHWHPEKAHV